MPVTDSEIMLTVYLMIFSCGYFAYMVNTIGSMVQGYNRFATETREKNIYINAFLLRRDIPEELRNRVRRYLDYLFE